MLKIIKRNGDIEQFQLEKICSAMKKAFDAAKKEYTDDIIELLALRVTADFQEKIQGGAVQIEDVQDSVEKVLAGCGYEDVAKAYILYRKQREKSACHEIYYSGLP